ncbi:hypothetical protein OH76DRAFT_1321030, partial [Lentinus brumalis]
EERQKYWTAAVYSFFKPEVEIVRPPGRLAQQFICAKPGCKQKVLRYIDKKDITSTSNLRGHVKMCWGTEILRAAEAVGKGVDTRPMVEVFGRTGTITSFFNRTGKGKVTYSIRQMTSKETRAWIVRWVAENKRPFEIVKDRAFLTLMKTGRPEHKIPSPATVSRDVRRVFAKCRARIARMLREFDGELNFTFDAWTSPNHKALLAFGVHLHHEGTPLSFILDVIEVAE